MIESSDWTVTHGKHNMVGRSKIMYAQVYDVIDRVGPSDVTVLITGESGVGKEKVARALYETSYRVGKPFVEANCAAIPRELLESELFGHRRGAYSGADYGREGLFGAANHGTIYLDEIAEMTPALQAKLLRVVQSRDVRKVGEDKSRTLDFRIICSTNKDLLVAMKIGEFREDLYYRLSAMIIAVPPLRERGRDIEYLIWYNIQQMKKIHGKEVAPFTPAELLAYQQYTWPGNVRELENAMVRIAFGTADKLAVLELMKKQSGYDEQTAAVPQVKVQQPLKLADVPMEERDEHLLNVLRSVGFNKTRAAQLLGIGHDTIKTKLDEISVDEIVMGKAAIIELFRRERNLELVAEQMGCDTRSVLRKMNEYLIAPEDIEF